MKSKAPSEAVTAAGGPVEGVTTENLRYPLAGRTLRMGSQDSVSNVIARANWPL